MVKTTDLSSAPTARERAAAAVCVSPRSVQDAKAIKEADPELHKKAFVVSLNIENSKSACAPGEGTYMGPVFDRGGGLVRFWGTRASYSVCRGVVFL